MIQWKFICQKIDMLIYMMSKLNLVFAHITELHQSEQAFNSL